MSSSMNMIEIWDKTGYEQVIQSDEEGFAKVAKEVMGNFEDEIDLS